MSNEHPDEQATNPADTAIQALSILRWAVIVAALVVLLPVLRVSSMTLLMGLFGSMMHGEMAAAGPDLFLVVGVIPLVLVLAAIYGGYRLYAADKH